MGKQRRSIQAYLVEPFKQIHFGLYVVSVCLVFVLILGTLFGWSYYEQYRQLMELYRVEDTGAVLDNAVFRKNAIIIGSVLFIFICSILYVVIRRTHKMYGPMININRYIGELIQGNYAARLKIRESDDFQNLVESINKLGIVLQERHGVIDNNPDGNSHSYEEGA